MDFNRLSSNERLAVYASVATIVGTLIATFLAGLVWFALLAGIAMLVVIFLPQLSSGTQLPGSKGGLMFLIGLIGGVAAVLALATVVPDLAGFMEAYPLQTLFLLLACAGGLVLAWTGWQEFQAGGSTWQAGPARDVDTTRSPASTGAGAAGAWTDSSRGQTGGGGADHGMGARPTATTTEGMGSTGPASTSAGSTSAGSTDMGSEGGGRTDRDDEADRRP